MSEIDGNFMLLNKKSLMATITSQLSTEIKKFKKIMLAEIQTINNLKIYEKKNIKRKTHIISVKWVFKKKNVTFLTFVKLKTKLMTKGFTQIFRVNYEKIYASIAKIASIRALLVVYTAKRWKIHQIDVNNVYLNSDIDIKRIYIK